MMDFIFEHGKILVFVVAGVVFLLNQFREAKKQEREAEQRTPPPGGIPLPEYPPAEYEWPKEWQEEKEQATPPPLHRQAAPPPLPVPSVPVVNEKELERQRLLQERLKAARQTKAALAGSFPGKKSKGKASLPPMVSNRLRDSLKNRKELKRAIILKEILGPPVGLK